MKQPARNVYQYDPANAAIYDKLGIAGTTYEIGFAAVERLVGDLTGRKVLDFGCGTGRSSAFATGLGAEVVYAVDHDAAMIEKIKSKNLDRVIVLATTGPLPLPTESIDVALSLSVFIEISTIETMRAVCREVARALVPGGTFVVMSTSPGAFGHTFRSFRYTAPSSLESGSRATCTITTPDGSFDIDDTYWAERDYVGALASAGFMVQEVLYPTASLRHEWTTDEGTVAPFIVIKAVKPRPAQRPFRGLTALFRRRARRT